VLLDFAIHHRQNETWSRKSTHVKTMLVHVVGWCYRLSEVWPLPPLSSLSLRQL
jgi:hypothetical protein